MMDNGNKVTVRIITFTGKASLPLPEEEKKSYGGSRQTYGGAKTVSYYQPKLKIVPIEELSLFEFDRATDKNIG